MRIIIVGAGISGLTTYLYLRKLLPNPSSHNITIYESHAPRTASTHLPAPTSSTFEELSTSTAIVGGGLGVSPNGLRVLRDLDPAIHNAVVAQGFVCEKFVFRTARGHRLGWSPTADKREPREWCVASSRHGLWRCLMEKVEEGVVRYRGVTKVFVGERGKPVVRLGDEGEEVEADLVVGADGVRSVVKKGIFGEEDEGRYKIHYEGQVGVGGFVDAPVPDEVLRDKSMVFTYGSNGFFGYCPWSPPSENNMGWWSTYEMPEAPDRTKIDLAELRQELKERHGNWRDKFIHDVIEKVDVDSIYPTYTTPELPHWGEDGMVLIGDAAHALQPTSGQGASRALESAQTFSLLLAHYLSKCGDESSDKPSVENAVRMSSKGLYEIRNKRITAIGNQAKKLAGGKLNHGIVVEYVTYLFLWIMINSQFIGKLILGDIHAVLYGWDAHAEVKKYTQKHDVDRAE